MANDFTAELQLIPFAGDTISGDQAMELAVAQLTAAPGSPIPETTAALGRGWEFDWENGVFARYGTAPSGVSGLDQLRQWIYKAVMTTRFANPIYTDFGTDTVDLIGDQFDAATLSDLAAAITAAILVHDRVTEVTDFVFSRPDTADDFVTVEFTVITGSDELTIEIPGVPVG